MSSGPRSVMRCLRVRSPVVEPVDSFHFRRHNGRNMSRIHSATVQVREIRSPAWMLNGLKQGGHFGQSFGTAHRGAGPEDLSAAAVVLPPEHDPVPASRRFALLKTTALETPAASRGERV